MTGVFSAELHVADNYTSDQPIIIQVRLSNVSSEDLFVLRSFTPLEGLYSPCFDVRTSDGKSISYDGVLVKRYGIKLQSFEFLPAGACVDITVELDTAYDVSSPGRYSVTLRCSPRYVSDSVSASILKATQEQQALLMKEVTLFSTTAEFNVLPGTHKRLTFGERNRTRHAEQVPVVDDRAATGTPTAPITRNTTPQQDTDILAAHAGGYQLAVNALGTLANNTAYERWFGSHTQNRFNRVKSVYGQVKTNMEGPAYTYDASGPLCQPTWLAYTSYGSSTIYLCNAFFALPASGTDSKEGTVLHEHTHCDANTEDITYGQANCLQLAINAPDDAVKNADSFEYYAGG